MIVGLLSVRKNIYILMIMKKAIKTTLLWPFGSVTRQWTVVQNMDIGTGAARK